MIGAGTLNVFSHEILHNTRDHMIRWFSLFPVSQVHHLSLISPGKNLKICICTHFLRIETLGMIEENGLFYFQFWDLLCQLLLITHFHGPAIGMTHTLGNLSSHTHCQMINNTSRLPIQEFHWTSRNWDFVVDFVIAQAQRRSSRDSRKWRSQERFSDTFRATLIIIISLSVSWKIFSREHIDIAQVVQVFHIINYEFLNKKMNFHKIFFASHWNS